MVFGLKILSLLCVLSSATVVNCRAQAHAQSQDRQAQLSWWDRSAQEKVGHYWIKTDLPAEEANSLAQHLNFMYGEYSKRLASMPVRVQEKLNVLIFEDRRDYELTLLARFGVTAKGSGGMFFVNSAAPGGALAFWTGGLPRQRIEHVIQHEGFHQFAYSRFGNDLPIWLNEGLAEFFGESLVVGDTFIIGQTTPRVIEAVKNAIELKTYVPFQHMLTMKPQQWGAALQDGTAALNYAQAWSMVHFLVYGDGGKYVAAFETYLKHLNTGLPSEEAFVRSFGPDITAFENRWKHYALAAKPSAFVTAMERIQFLAEGALKLARLGLYPSDLDELRAALQEINFVHTLNTHGVEVKLSASDDAMFTIPADDLSDPAKPAAFVMSTLKIGRLTARERVLEEANPTPPIISTENLQPRSMAVKWIRGEDNSGFTYQIVMK